jgi:hypothetical protein
VPPGRSGYAGKLGNWAWEQGRWILAIIKRNADIKGWQLLPRRWVVERTFAWLGRYRRLSKDYEEHTSMSETMIKVAMIHLMVRRYKDTGKKRVETQREKARRRSREAIKKLPSAQVAAPSVC